MCLRFKDGKYNILWPVYILRYALPIISMTFFGQIFIMLMSIFKCLSGQLYYLSYTKCETNSLYYITLFITCIGIILQLVLSYITVSLYYHADFVNESGSILKKNNPLSEIMLLLNKILFIIIFMFDKEVESEHWPILCVLVISTGFNAYANIFCQNYGNEIIKKIHYFGSLFIFWGFLCLFISNIFKSLNFSGAFYFFLCGVIIIFIYCIFYVKTNLQFLNSNYSEINSSYDFLNYIYTYMKLIKEKEISRDSSIILNSFIEKVEEKCSNNKCVLKRYQQSLSKGFDSNFLLLQYAQKLFKLALNRLPKDINLRIHYIIFLASKINQKKNAQKELSSIKPVHMPLYKKFNIFICKKYTEDNASLLNNNSQSQKDNESSDIFQEIEYKNNYKEFLNLLTKSSSLYYEFWTSLYTSHLQGTEDFRKLNDIGAELNIIIEQIEKTFEKLREIKNNDLTIIKLYESYLKNILNNEEKYEKYHKISNNLITDNKFDFDDKDYTNFDIKNMNNNDEYQFLIISANDDNKGTIINMSLNTCLYFGYTKDEIIGKDMCILIPELFHKTQKKLFIEETEKIKTEFFENLSNKITYIPKFKELSGFGRNKLKYLIPIDLKVFFVQTEESDLVYIVDLLRKNLSINNDLNETTTENEKGQTCCVLTDNNFIIQTFTANSVEILGLDSKMINSNYDITNFIIQFNDELQTLVSSSNKEASLHEASEVNEHSIRDLIIIGDNMNDKSFEAIIRQKKKLLKLKYSHQRKILWKVNISNNNNFSSSNNKKHFSGISQKKVNGDSKKKFLMEVKEAKVSKNTVGYYFYFKKSNQGRNEASLLSVGKNENLPTNRTKLKSSVKFIEDEEEQHEPAKSSRLHDDDVKSILGNNEAKKNNNVSFDLDNLISQKKHESAKYVSEFKDENDDAIDEKFVPKSKFNFALDLVTKIFKPTNTPEETKETYDNLRSQALEKINIVYQLKKKMNKKKSNSELSSKEGSSNSDLYTSSYIDSSSNSGSKKEESKIKSKIEEKPKNEEKIEKNNKENNVNEKKKEVNIENEYYKISIAKIKFMVYDFNKEMVISTKNEKKSQVELIIDNYKSRQNINISEDSNFVGLSFEKYMKDLKNKSDKNSSRNLNQKKISEHKITEKNNVIDAAKEFEKEITYSLSRQEDQKSIRYFYITSFFFLFALLAIFISEIFFVTTNYRNFKDNLDLIISSIQLKYYTNIGIFSLRETVLNSLDNSIANITYDFPDSDYLNYTNTIYSISKDAFTSCNTHMEKIIGNNLKLSDYTMNILDKQPYNITIIYGDNQFREVTSTLISSIIQVYSAFCNLLQNSFISPSSTYLYIFMHNSLNKIESALNIQINLFLKEIGDKGSTQINIMIIYSVVYIFINVLLFIMITKGFIIISNKKSSYISVFYGIDLSLIKSSIRKCEFFINKINQNEKNDKLKLVEEEDSTIISTSNFNLNSPLNSKKEKKNHGIKKNRNMNNDRRTKHFKIMLLIGLILSVLIFEVILLSTLLLVNKFAQSVTYLYHLQRYHINIIELFNAFRENMFDENTIISGMKVNDYLKKKEEDFYKTNMEDINSIFTLQSKISGLEIAIKNLEEKGFCSNYIAQFSSEEECQKYVGGKEGILNFGFVFIVNEFVDDIRYARNILKNFLSYPGVIVGNLTLHDNITDAKILNEQFKLNPFSFYRLYLFNTFLHSRLNIRFMNIIMQYIIKERDVSINSIQNNVEGGYIIYVILIIIFGAIICIIFFFYWIPLIRKLNMEIYKTKNMLTIIPVQILASLPNIRDLLNISNKR